MKKRFLIHLLMGCAVVLSMSSCIDDDDDDSDSFTQAQLTEAYNTVKGEYAGTISCYKVESSNTLSTDTLTRDIEWEIASQSYLTIKDFPSELVAMYINDETISAAVAEQGSQNLLCTYSTYSVSPIVFLLNPVTMSYSVTYDGADHVIKIPFYVNSLYSYATYSSTDETLSIQIVAGAVYVDDVLKSAFVSDIVPYVLVGSVK